MERTRNAVETRAGDLTIYDITLLYDHDNCYCFSLSCFSLKSFCHTVCIYGHANKASCCYCQESVSIAFSSSVSLVVNRSAMFVEAVFKITKIKKKNEKRKHVYFDNQKVNSLCSRYHYANISR